MRKTTFGCYKRRGNPGPDDAGRHRECGPYRVGSGNLLGFERSAQHPGTRTVRRRHRGSGRDGHTGDDRAPFRHRSSRRYGRLDGDRRNHRFHPNSRKFGHSCFRCHIHGVRADPSHRYRHLHPWRPGGHRYRQAGHDGGGRHGQQHRHLAGERRSGRAAGRCDRGCLHLSAGPLRRLSGDL